MWRQTWAEVDLSNFAHNVRLLQSVCKPNVQMMASVKANAYGHGAVAISRAAVRAGVEKLGVATYEEAVELRQGGITAPILVYGALSESVAEVAAEHDIMASVSASEDVQRLQAAAQRVGRIVEVHVKIDTGMVRLGVRGIENFMRLLHEIARAPYLHLAGVYTHFSFADEPLEPLVSVTERQRILFESAIRTAREQGFVIPLVHAANSGALLRNPLYHYDMVRPGIALYGYHPAPQWGQRVDLRPVLSLYTSVVRLADLPQGEGVSYGGAFTSDRPERIATLPIGYADGIPRGLSNRGLFSVQGHCARIAGRVCMDQLMIIVTELAVKVGDVVQIYGKDADSVCASMEQLSTIIDTIPYELLCRISDRVPRIYKNTPNINVK